MADESHRVSFSLRLGKPQQAGLGRSPHKA